MLFLVCKVNNKILCDRFFIGCQTEKDRRRILRHLHGSIYGLIFVSMGHDNGSCGSQNGLEEEH